MNEWQLLIKPRFYILILWVWFYVCKNRTPAKKIYQFLREALKKTIRDKPFRGPDNLKRNNFEYVNKVKGTIEKFEGQETIFYKKQLVYKLSYHGGLIMTKYDLLIKQSEYYK